MDKNTIKSEIQYNAGHCLTTEKLISRRIEECVAWIGLGNTATIKSLSELSITDTDAERLVEIFNLSKTLEVVKSNHKAKVRELNEQAEEDSE
jgi:hypothetical protein